MSEKTVAKKRLAIQFYGYLRSFESCRESFFENCVKPIEDAGFEVDIFMHTWDEVDGKTTSWSSEKPAGEWRAISTPSHETLTALYGLKKVMITPQIENADTEKFVKCRYELDYRYKSILNPYFSIFSVNSLRCEYEKEMGVKYDLVIITRLDLFFHSKLDLSWLGTYTKNKIFGFYTLMECEQAGLDQFYITEPQIINKVAQIYKTLNYEALQKANLYNPEGVLQNFCLDNRIEILSINSWSAPFYIKRTKEYIALRTPSQNDENKIIQINENELKKLRNLEHFSGFVKFYFHKRFRHLQVYSRRFRYPIKDFFRRIFKKTKR